MAPSVSENFISLVTCVGCWEEEPQTAYPMSLTWASHIASSVLTGCLTPLNQKAGPTLHTDITFWVSVNEGMFPQIFLCLEWLATVLTFMWPCIESTCFLCGVTANKCVNLPSHLVHLWALTLSCFATWSSKVDLCEIPMQQWGHESFSVSVNILCIILSFVFFATTWLITGNKDYPGPVADIQQSTCLGILNRQTCYHLASACGVTNCPGQKLLCRWYMLAYYQDATVIILLVLFFSQWHQLIIAWRKHILIQWQKFCNSGRFSIYIFINSQVLQHSINSSLILETLTIIILLVLFFSWCYQLIIAQRKHILIQWQSTTVVDSAAMYWNGT